MQAKSPDVCTVTKDYAFIWGIERKAAQKPAMRIELGLCLICDLRRDSQFLHVFINVWDHLSYSLSVCIAYMAFSRVFADSGLTVRT